VREREREREREVIQWRRKEIKNIYIFKRVSKRKTISF
jgi:hypothetical protein